MVKSFYCWFSRNHRGLVGQLAVKVECSDEIDFVSEDTKCFETDHLFEDSSNLNVYGFCLIPNLNRLLKGLYISHEVHSSGWVAITLDTTEET